MKHTVARGKTVDHIDDGTKTKRSPKQGFQPGNRTRSKYDWDAIEDFFVNGREDQDDHDKRVWPKSLKDAAEEFGIPYDQVRQRSSARRWPERKTEAFVAYNTKIRNARLSKLGDQGVEFDDQMLSMARLSAGLIQTRLIEISKHHQSSQLRRQAIMERYEAGEKMRNKEETYSAIYYVELERLANAMKTIQEVGQRALGTNTERLEVSAHTTVSGSVEHQVSIQDQLRRNDPNRIAAVLSLIQRTEYPWQAVAGIVEANELGQVQEEGVDNERDIDPMQGDESKIEDAIVISDSYTSEPSPYDER